MNHARRNIILNLCFILAFGLLMLKSASVARAEFRHGDGAYFLQSQTIWIGLGLALMAIFSRVDYHRYQRHAKLLLLASILLLAILVLPFTKSIAPVINGVRRWIVYPFTFQPSEITRPALVIWCATTILNKGSRIQEFKVGILPIALVISFVLGLIAIEPALSSTILTLAIVMVVLFLSGARPKHLLYMLLVIGAFAYLGVSIKEGSMKDYWVERIEDFWNPDQELLEGNYQSNQSQIGIGSGGWTGRGIGNSFQKHFFLPEPHTDFIFAVIGEELGFLLTVVFLCVFSLLGYWGYRVMVACRDLYGFLLVGGILAMIFVPLLINVAINLGMLPAAGVGLPLVSYGGSSIVTLLAGIGIILNVSGHSRIGTGYLKEQR